MKETGKFGFWSIVLLGINGIVGTGIFLLPNKAYSIIGSASLGVLLFDAVIAGCIALCFAEAVQPARPLSLRNVTISQNSSGLADRIEP